MGATPPEATRGASSLERALRRDRAISVLALALLCAAAWAYVISGAGMGTAAWRMTSLGPPSAPAAAGMADMPGMSAPTAPPRQGLAAGLLLVAMWWSMMVAMMAPSAAPMVLLYARVTRSNAAQSDHALARTGCFVAGYLAVWLGFSILAATLQGGLARLAWISPVTMGAQNRSFAAGVLVFAGLYQLSAIQQLCLQHCRSPATFLSRQYRPGAAGALRLGVVHGAYCVGCCWLLMALLFVGGVMNLIWIAALTLLVVGEKILPGGRWIGRAAGLVLLAAGLFILAGVAPVTFH